ncbi:MAG: hypothetical protein COB17_11250 [Sulfurimonas sp.]|nr:MAG: hypothetical protein COB17_11250 [Sulfurimonas sp.]
MKIILLIMIGLSLLQAKYIRDDAKELVLDTTTKLMWQDDTTPSTMNWSSALNYCEALTLGGYSNWRLANFNELYFLADRTIFSPAINPVFKNVVSSFYWSSSTYVADNTLAWNVYFSNGYDYANNKTDNYYVRCVR